MGRGWSDHVDFWCSALTCWQTTHGVTYSLISRFIFCHQYILQIHIHLSVTRVNGVWRPMSLIQQFSLLLENVGNSNTSTKSESAITYLKSQSESVFDFQSYLFQFYIIIRSYLDPLNQMGWTLMLFSRGDDGLRRSNRVGEDDGLKQAEANQMVLISLLIRCISLLTHKTPTI